MKMQTEINILLSPLQLRLFDILINNGSKNREQICEIMGYGSITYQKRDWKVDYHEKRTTIYDNLEKLEKAGIVERYTKHNDKPGRPPIYWKITENYRNY